MLAVVMGRNYTSLLGMIRAAGMAGCEVIAIRTVNGLNRKIEKNRHFSDGAVERASKYVKEHYFVDQDRETLVRFLLEKCSSEGQKRVLLPTDDFVASTVDLNQDRLKEYFVFPHIHHKQGEIVRYMDKKLQKDLARKAGLNVAEGWVVNIRNGQYEIPEGIVFPVFTKPEISFLGNKRYMKRCNNEEDLVDVIKDVMKERECPLLVEQFIEIKKEYGILGFSNKGSAVIPGIVNKIAIGHGAHNGVTLIGSYSSLMLYGDLKRKLQEFMREVGFTGLFDIDLYESNGIIFFNELNLRLGAFGYAAVRAGINMPEMLIKALRSDEYESEDIDYQGSIKCINEKVNLDDYSAGYITWKQYKKNLQVADRGFISDEEDVQPYKIFTSSINGIRFRRTIKNIIRR